MRYAQLLPDLVGALLAACDGGAPVAPTQPANVMSIDTLRPGQVATPHWGLRSPR